MTTIDRDRRRVLDRTEAATTTTLEGQQIGAYTLERPLGRGGMGFVWLARRSDGRFEGKAAVKFLDLALSNAAGVERFRREGSVLAKLKHSGIARLLDAGVSSAGEPYLLLEYIDGTPIDAYVDAHALSREDRVGLVLQVLDAVGHAHANLIVHRDLKPSNIFVTADGKVKLLDFGIAKLFDPEAARDHTRTVEGGRPFSLLYAAPEQMRNEAITIGTDVYALGVLLYTLLAGHHPLDFTGQSQAEIERIICDDDPPGPATGTDLDAIVLKAIRKEPFRRYASAAEFADDLHRFLDGRPVVARPARASYRARRFVARHRAGVAVTAALAALVVGFAFRERALRAESDQEARRASAVEQYVESIFEVSGPLNQAAARADSVSARMLDQRVERLDSTLAKQPDARADTEQVLAQVYERLGLFDRSVALYRQVLAYRRATLVEPNLRVAEVLFRLGSVLVRLNDYAEADSLIEQSLAERRALVSPSDTSIGASITSLAHLALLRSHYPEAESLYRTSLDLYRKALGPEHPDVVELEHALGVALSVDGNVKEAEPLLREALRVARRQRGVDDVSTIPIELALAQALQQLGKYGEADTLYRDVQDLARRRLGERHPSVRAK